MALSLKQKLFDYFAQRHFDLMTPEVRARFDDYAKNEDFQGHMKHWNDNYVGATLPDLLATGSQHQLTPTEWEELYDAFQEAFQAMDSAKTPSVGFEGPYKKATLDFIKKYFGDSSKTFTTTSATSTTETDFSNLHAFLVAHRASLEIPLKRALPNIFKDGFSYNDLISKLASKKYNSDFKFRSLLEDFVGTIWYYRNNPDYSVFPKVDGLTPDLNLSHLGATDPKTWYAISNKPRHINQFKSDFSEIFDTLLTKSSVRADFLDKASSKISDPLTKAIELTDYENKDSKDYVPEKYPDEKNWRQELEDWKNNTYEDYFRKFVNPSRGTRIYFSPWSQNIIKAFDKAKIKPTDGLGGILKNKDAIAKNLKSSKTSSDHFKWFTDTIEKLQSAGMGKAVEGALRNGAQMRHLVSGLIAEAVKNGKVKEAKTALEILSVAKYGLLSSRTLDAIRKADMTIFSDGKLSWNKNEGIKMVTSAVDKTARAAVVGISAGIVGINNFIQHRRTKIGNDIRNNSVLKKAHDKWEQEDNLALTNKQNENRRMNVDMKLDTLAHGHGLSGRVIANETDLTNAENALSAMAPGAAGYDDLKADIDLYKDSKSRKDAVTNWRDDHKDQYQELISYWDMLESVGKTHSFTLGSIGAKRKAYLKNFTRGTSQAQNDFNAYLARYGSLRTA